METTKTDRKPPSAVAGSALERGLTPRMLNHAAWVTHDVAATADFYTRILGMEIAHTILDDAVPSTGDDFPYFHIFFRMQDGSTLAFFDCADLPLPSKSSHPAYDVFNHIALQVEDTAELQRWRDWLLESGVEVLGPIDHKGIIESIYFHDPNGIRLELTTPVDPKWNRHTEQGYADLKVWVEAKQAAQRDGKDIREAMVELIQGLKAKRYQHGENA